MSDKNDLGQALENYTDPTHPDYDPEFDARMRRERPEWFKDELKWRHFTPADVESIKRTGKRAVPRKAGMSDEEYLALVAKTNQ